MSNDRSDDPFEWSDPDRIYQAARRHGDTAQQQMIISVAIVKALERGGRLLTSEVWHDINEQLARSGAPVPWAHMLTALRELCGSQVIEGQRNGGGGVLYRLLT